ncbi:MAG: hypothetical protein AAGC95_02835, partial [Pseudomonadota bacterium]
RGLLCKTQTVETHRNPVRQARSKLPWLHKDRKHNAMDKMIKSSLQPSHYSQAGELVPTLVQDWCGSTKMS